MLGRRLPVVVVALATWLPAAGLPAQPLEVLVTNDDGVAAPGIDAVVAALAANPNVVLTVIAPATNQSGTGDQFTGASGSIQVQASSTAGAFPAEAVSGFPADTVLFALRERLQSSPPDLVVSGVNNGQNLSGEIIPLSGTVGAAYWAARLGVPAFAVSAGLGGSPNYAQAASFTARLVEKYRISRAFRRRMMERGAPFRALVLNINFPTCTSGAVRGVRVVAVGRATVVTSYTLQSDMGGVQTWKPVTSSTNIFAPNCTSTLEDPVTDVEAFTNGFATVSPLDDERTINGHRLREFRFVEKFFP
jgi:5'-nucleotidase